jgi:hypothetical protein
MLIGRTFFHKTAKRTGENGGNRGQYGCFSFSVFSGFSCLTFPFAFAVQTATIISNRYGARLVVTKPQVGKNFLALIHRNIGRIAWAVRLAPL